MALTPLILMAGEGILNNTAFQLVPVNTGGYTSQVIVADYLNTVSVLQGGSYSISTVNTFIAALDATAPYISNRAPAGSGTDSVSYTTILNKHIENLYDITDGQRDMKFVQYALVAMGAKETANKWINSAVNGANLVPQTFTSQDALMSGNITAINTNIHAWGTELFNTGSLYDFGNLCHSGSPQSIVEMLIRIDMLPTLATELDAQGISVFDLQKALADDPSRVLKPLTQKRCYDAFATVTGDKLAKILSVLEFTTPGITTLADLLDLRKVFPTTFATLTFPVNGVLQRIYTGTNISTYTDALETNATATMPADQAKANFAFTISLQQVKGIQQTTPQSLAEIAQTIENNSGLPVTNALAIPLPASSVATIKSLFPDGSGPDDTFYLTDFIGAPAGEPYNTNFGILINNLSAVQTAGGFADIAYVLSIIRSPNSYGSVDPDYPFGSGDSAFIFDDLYFPIVRTATQIEAGYEYEIVTAGTTDFTLIGAPNNLPGTQFTATGPGTGTGTVYEKLTASGTAHQTGGGLPDYDSAILALIPDLDRATDFYIASYPTQHNIMWQAHYGNSIGVVGAIKTLWENNLRFETTYVTNYQSSDHPDIDQDGFEADKITALAFAENLPQYGRKTNKYDIAVILEAMARRNTQGGNAIIAAMREGRNMDKLSSASIQTDNLISDQSTTVEPGNIS